MSYYCNHCHKTFDYAIKIDHDFETGTDDVGCPYCAEDDFEEAKPCKKCGAYMPESQSLNNLCHLCEQKAQSRFLEMLKTFTPEERQFLNWRYDGQEF